MTKTLITLASIGHFDETSLNVNGAKWWLHVAATDTLTAYHLHPSRGRVAVDEFGVLPKLTGTAVHDALSVYDGENYLAARHALCGAHIARELTAAAESQPDQAWPHAALDALHALNQAAHDARTAGKTQIPRRQRQRLIDNWRHAILCGLADHPEQPGRKQSKTRNLLLRLHQRDKQVLLFAQDLTVPYSNNQAERDLRPVKTQMKISGCARSETHARAWLPHPRLHLHRTQEPRQRHHRTTRRDHRKPLHTYGSRQRLNGYVLLLFVILGDEVIANRHDLDADVGRLRSKGVPVVVVWDPDRSYTDQAPEVLHAVNGFAWRHGDPPTELITFLKRLLGIDESTRRVFLSYRRNSSEGLALQLRQRLIDSGWHVFLDQFNIDPAVNFQAELFRDLDGRSLVLLIEEPDTHESSWVDSEIAFANSHGIGISVITPTAVEKPRFGKQQIIDVSNYMQPQTVEVPADG